MDIPVVSERTDLTLDECKAEYVRLKEVLSAGNWADWLIDKIESRRIFLAVRMADILTGDKK
jgi:hypothetical protein